MNRPDEKTKSFSNFFCWVEHTNGTYSIRDLSNDQAMHSRIGPWEEAKQVYAEPSKPEVFLSQNKKLVIHDVGMGTGANVIAALERIRLAGVQFGSVEIHSFELKPDGVRFALTSETELPFLTSEYRDALEVLLEQGTTTFQIGGVSVHWFLHLGDYFEKLAGTPAPDLIYYDFYSPKVVPELWTEDAFRQVAQNSGSHPLRLFTYSAATPTRLHLLLAGFFVGEGRSTGIKTETTIAASSENLLEKPLTREWLKKLETSASIADHPGKNRVLSHPQFNRF